MSKRERDEQFDIDGYDAIRKVVDLAMQGAEKGDVAKLKKVFGKMAVRQAFGHFFSAFSARRASS